jgi:NTE family protein
VAVASVAVVLGAGGLTGRAFHAGVLAGLAAHGFDARSADLFVGTSAGAGIASTARAGFAASDQVANVLGEPIRLELAARMATLPPPVSLPRTMRRPPGPPVPSSLRLAAQAFLRRETPRVGLFVAGTLPTGDHPTERIGARIRGLFAEPWPTEPLWVCALRHDDGARVVFGRDGLRTDVGTAVEASSAVPGFFRPVIIGGDRYLDGGVHSPSNLDLVAGLGFDLVIVSSPMTGTVEAIRPASRHLARWYHRRLLEREAERVRRTGTAVLIFEPDPVTLHLIGDEPLDPARNREIVAAADAGVEARLAVGDELTTAARGLLRGSTART